MVIKMEQYKNVHILILVFCPPRSNLLSRLSLLGNYTHTLIFLPLFSDKRHHIIFNVLCLDFFFFKIFLK